MHKPNFTTPDLDTFCLLDSLDLTAVGQDANASHGVLECHVREPDAFCHSCGLEGIPSGTVVRRLAHLPVG